MWKRIFSTIACIFVVLALISPVCHSAEEAELLNNITEFNQILYTPHSPIRINSNADFDAAHGVVNWATGNGTVWNPWIIEEWDINGSALGTCIFIGNTTDYFEVRDNHLHHANGLDGWPYFRDCGIHLYYATNGTIINNDVHSNYWDGTLFFYSDYNNVSGNTFYYSNSGIYSEGSNYNTFYDNTIHHNQKGIYLIEAGFDPSDNNTWLEEQLASERT